MEKKKKIERTQSRKKESVKQRANKFSKRNRLNWKWQKSIYVKISVFFKNVPLKPIKWVWTVPLTPPFVLSLIYVSLAGSIVDYFGIQISLSGLPPISNWEEARSFGLYSAGIIGGWIAMLGIYYSAKRTRALDDDNRIKLDASRQNNFLEAVKLLKDESPFVVAGAIEGLRKLGLEPDARYFSDTIHLLAAFIRETSNLPKKESMLGHINVNFTNIQNAFGAIISIIDSHSDTTYELHFKKWPVDLRHSSLDNIEVRRGSNLKNLDLSFCSLKSAKLWDCKFRNTQLEGADLSGADFTNATLCRSAYEMLTMVIMDETIISNCNFNGTKIWESDQLATCLYERSCPPFNIWQEVTFHEIRSMSEQNIYLATPFDLNSAIVPPDEFERHLTRAETIDFYKRNPQYRPLDPIGQPITLIDPNDPDNPIID